MKNLEYIHFSSREEYRGWLERHYNISPGFWMVYYKKLSKVQSISYDEALEESLCFGWVDSIIKKIDEEKYSRKFTPRINTTNWSDYNKKKIGKLIESDKMTKAGLDKIDPAILSSILNKDLPVSSKKQAQELKIPDFIIDEFSKNEPALENFNNLAPSHKREYVLWITNAKREATIQKRIKESISLLIENKKLGLR